MGVISVEINVSQGLCVREGPIKPDTDTLTLKCTKKKRLSISIRRWKMHSQKLQLSALQWFTRQENYFYQVFNLYFLLNELYSGDLSGNV